MNDLDNEEGLDQLGTTTRFVVMVEEIESGDCLPREHLTTTDEMLARKTYYELVARGYQARLIKETLEFWRLEQTAKYGRP